jgi:hypothetical protein
MRGDKQALALIFDAMAFLTIITIVSVTLLQAFSTDVANGNMDQYLSEVNHSILGSDLERNGVPTPLSIKDALVTALVQNDTLLQRTIVEQVERLLTDYLSPQYRYHWTAEYGGRSIQVGDELLDKGRGSIYSVSMNGSDGQGDLITYTLSVAR